MTRSSYRGSWTYRLTFSVGGVVFATTSYIAGIYAYGVESISWGNTDFGRTLARDLLGAFQSHQITFLGWMLVCGAIAGIIAHLFEKERYFREKAEQRANVDGLTDLYNHRYFQERLREETERADRFNRNVSLIMLDIDDFKKFNDTWGHQEGDKLLKWFSNLCTRCVRGMDVVARYGGEEFVVILPEADSDVALKVAERIRHVTETQSCAHLGKAKRITVSAGVAAYPEHGQTRHALQVNVDAALYYAKQRGKNQCFIYRSEHHRSYRVSADQVKALLAEKDIGAVEALAEAADARDEHAAGHSAAVMKISVELAESMGMTAEQVDSVRIAALLHDLGKIGTPEQIFQKSAPLSEQERQQVEDHAGLGSAILERVQQVDSIVPAVRHHHERYDGKGYPSGLTGKEIPLSARIIAIAEAYDAMVSDRSYKNTMTSDEAINELRRCAGTQFDPDLVELFVKILRSGFEPDKEQKAA